MKWWMKKRWWMNSCFFSIPLRFSAILFVHKSVNATFSPLSFSPHIQILNPTSIQLPKSSVRLTESFIFRNVGSYSPFCPKRWKWKKKLRKPFEISSNDEVEFVEDDDDVDNVEMNWERRQLNESESASIISKSKFCLNCCIFLRFNFSTDWNPSNEWKWILCLIRGFLILWIDGKRILLRYCWCCSFDKMKLLLFFDFSMKGKRWKHPNWAQQQNQTRDMASNQCIDNQKKKFTSSHWLIFPFKKYLHFSFDAFQFLRWKSNSIDIFCNLFFSQNFLLF